MLYNDNVCGDGTQLISNHERIVWLSPTHHRQGIMSAVLKALITEWCVPMMDMRTLKSSAFVGNAGSIGTVQKCGFVKEYTLEKASADMPAYKYGGGGRQDIVVLKWVRR